MSNFGSATYIPLGTPATGTQFGPWVDISQANEFSFQYTWTSTSALSAKPGVQVSNDRSLGSTGSAFFGTPEALMGPVEWTANLIATGSTGPAGGATGTASTMYSYRNVSAKWIRGYFQTNSGAGSFGMALFTKSYK